MRFLLPRPLLAGLAMAGAALIDAAPAQAAPERVTVTGEVIDSWCYVTQIMYPEGTAHHLCAVWCAAGGVPVGIKDAEGNVYMVLKYEEETDSVANPKVLEIQTHQVKVDGDLFERDGVKYLLVNEVVADEGIVNLTHDEYGIQPFGE